MFGNLAAFVNGNMFIGLFGSQIGVRLSEIDRDSLLAEEGAGSFGPDDRPMRAYVSLPSEWEAEQASPWIAKALFHTATLPAKARRPKKR